MCGGNLLCHKHGSVWYLGGLLLLMVRAMRWLGYQFHQFFLWRREVVFWLSKSDLYMSDLFSEITFVDAACVRGINGEENWSLTT